MPSSSTGNSNQALGPTKGIGAAPCRPARDHGPRCSTTTGPPRRKAFSSLRKITACRARHTLSFGACDRGLTRRPCCLPSRKPWARLPRQLSGGWPLAWLPCALPRESEGPRLANRLPHAVPHVAVVERVGVAMPLPVSGPRLQAAARGALCPFAGVGGSASCLGRQLARPALQ